VQQHRLVLKLRVCGINYVPKWELLGKLHSPIEAKKLKAAVFTTNP